MHKADFAQISTERNFSVVRDDVNEITILTFFFISFCLFAALLKTLFKSVLTAIENGGKPARINASTSVGYSKEQAEVIQRLKTAKDNYERLGLPPGATK